MTQEVGTLLPYPDYDKAATVFDDVTLRAQLGYNVVLMQCLLNGGWANGMVVSLAVQDQWRGAEEALRLYHEALACEYHQRPRQPWHDSWFSAADYLHALLISTDGHELGQDVAPWMLMPGLHRAHRRWMWIRGDTMRLKLTALGEDFSAQ